MAFLKEKNLPDFHNPEKVYGKDPSRPADNCRTKAHYR